MWSKWVEVADIEIFLNADATQSFDRFVTAITSGEDGCARLIVRSQNILGLNCGGMGTSAARARARARARKYGFQPSNISYRSSFAPIESRARQLLPRVARNSSPDSSTSREHRCAEQEHEIDSSCSCSCSKMRVPIKQHFVPILVRPDRIESAPISAASLTQFVAGFEHEQGAPLR